MASLSVRTKLLLLSFVLIVIPGAVFAVLAARDATQALEGAVGRQLATVASHAAQDLADELREVHHEVRGWARQELMREVIVGDVDKRVSRFLLGLREHNAAYVDLRVSDPHGRTIAAADPDALGTEVAGDTWRRALAAADLVTTGPVRYPRTGRHVLEMATPVHDPEDPSAVPGVLIASYDWGAAGVSFRDTRKFLAAIGLDVDIPPAVRPHIFTPFFTKRQGGTGLGLAVVERIVRAHHGTVTFETALERGTTFRVELPAAEAA